MTPYASELLDRAISLWEAGRFIPLTLYAQLAQEGFDVPALEAKHLKD